MKLHKSWTTVLVAGTLVVHCVSGLGALLIYDRAAIAEGQIWRLASGSFVHFSAAHLASNLIVIAIAGWIIESRFRSGALVLYALCAIAIGAVLYTTDPRLVQYRGASGIAYAALTYLALQGLALPAWRPASIALLVLVGVKLLAESWWGWSLVDHSATGDIITVPASHATGVAIATVLFLRHLYANRTTEAHPRDTFPTVSVFPRKPEAN